MADTKLSALTADATPTGDDLVYTVNDPGGTPASRKVTINNLLRYAETFVDADLTAGVITITHSRNYQYPGVFVTDNGDNLVTGFDVSYTDANNLNLSLVGFGTLTGTWRVVVI